MLPCQADHKHHMRLREALDFRSCDNNCYETVPCKAVQQLRAARVRLQSQRVSSPQRWWE
jgi:hypothetical protein